jgi:hypothetical protein
MSASHERRALSNEYEITVLCLVAVFDVSFEVVRWLQASDPIKSNLFAVPVPLVLAVGELIVLYGLTNARSWGHRWALGVYASGLLVNLGAIRVMGAVFDVVILVWLLSKADYFR